MNCEAIGAAGEVGGAIAVVARLEYLAVQIRQSNQLERNESQRTWVRDWNSVVLAPMLDREFSEMLRRGGRAFESLTGAEQVTWNAFWGGAVLLVENLHMLGAKGDVDEQLVTTTETVTASLLRVPGVETWWQSGHVHFTREFVDHMTTLSREQAEEGSPAYHEMIPWFVDREASTAGVGPS